jgi:D-tyrosyl-tRNA(Tyr) deacylase
VNRVSVRVQGELESSIGRGLLVLIGIAATDTRTDADYLVDRVVNLRIFPDKDGRMNHSVADINGALMLVSQFTLYGDCRKGRRPGFDAAAPAELARTLYEYVVSEVRETGLVTATGVFQAHMEVGLVNDGPVTFMLESLSSK